MWNWRPLGGCSGHWCVPQDPLSGMKSGSPAVGSIPFTHQQHCRQGHPSLSILHSQIRPCWVVPHPGLSLCPSSCPPPHVWIQGAAIPTPHQKAFCRKSISEQGSYLIAFQWVYLQQEVKEHFFKFIFISWRLITLQYYSGFCHTLTWISHGFTCIPHPDPPFLLPFYPIPLALPSVPGLSTCLMHPTWAGDLFHPR